jgi:hypothetical protein
MHGGTHGGGERLSYIPDSASNKTLRWNGMSVTKCFNATGYFREQIARTELEIILIKIRHKKKWMRRKGEDP